MNFEEVYRQHAASLLAFLTSRVQPRADVADVAQEVWTRAWTKRSQFRGGNFRAWLFEIARNLLIDRSRRPGLQPLPEGYDVAHARSPDGIALEREEQERLKDCLKRLRAEEHALVRGRLGGEDYEELSARLGLTVKQAHRLFHTAKARLQECVGERRHDAGGHDDPR
jgi:RNA polymerase sigma-70 factor (ECF subfamily)